MISRDFVGGLAAVVIGGVYLYFAYQLRVSALDDSLGPSGMPRIYGWLLVGLGVILASSSVVSRRLNPTSSEGRSAWDGQARRLAWAAGLLAIGVAYLVVVGTLGYLASITLLILGTAGYLGATFGMRLVAIACLGAAALWALFVLVLGVPMPSGLPGGIGL